MSYAEQISRYKAIARLLKEWGYEKPLTKQVVLEMLSAADVLDASKKTIQRDIKRLKEDYEAPIEYSPQKGFHLTDPTWICDFDLEEVEAQDVYALALATELAAQLEGTPLHEHLSRLEKILKQRYEQSSIYNGADLQKKVQFLSPPAAVVNRDIWNAVIDGLLDKKWMKIKYCRYGGEASEMEIAPCRLVSLENEWYLFSEKRTTARPQIRQLAMRNIKNAEVLSSHFQNEHEKEINSMLEHRFGWFACEREIQTITVVFDKAVSYLLDTRVWHKKQEKRILENGDLEISFPTSAAGQEQFRFFEVRKWIQSYAGYVKKVEPELLRNLVLADIKTAQETLDGP